MNGKLRVLVADDHAVLRSGLRLLINSQPDMEVVAEAGDGRDAIRKTSEAKPDVLLFDLTMPRTNAMDTIRHVARTRPKTKVVVLTMHEQPAYVQSARGGRRRLRGQTRRRHRAALDHPRGRTRRGRRRARGRHHAARCAGTARPPPTAPARGLLSPREDQVLRLLAQGHSNRQIAARLKLSVKTVETFRARLSKKLRLRGRSALVRYALRTGVVTIENLPQDIGPADAERPMAYRCRAGRLPHDAGRP